MKIWRFYKKPREGMHITDEELKQAYPLYAVTQTKKLAKKFKEQRNMDLFLEKCTNVNDEIADEYIMAHRSRMLFEDYLESIITHDTGDTESKFVKLVHTDNELEYMTELTDSNQILYMIGKYVPVEIFKDLVQEQLVLLKYHEFVNFMVEGYGNSADGFYQMNYQYDMFRTFLLLFGDTFKSDFIRSIRYISEDEMSEQDWMTAAKNG